MTHQQIKKFIASIMTLEAARKTQTLRDRSKEAIKESKEAYIEAEKAVAEDEAAWIWEIVQGTGVSSYDARRYWETVRHQVWFDGWMSDNAKRKAEQATIA